jgi:hypothetical protein
VNAKCATWPKEDGRSGPGIRGSLVYVAGRELSIL